MLAVTTAARAEGRRKSASTEREPFWSNRKLRVGTERNPVPTLSSYRALLVAVGAFASFTASQGIVPFASVPPVSSEPLKKFGPCGLPTPVSLS